MKPPLTSLIISSFHISSTTQTGEYSSRGCEERRHTIHPRGFFGAVYEHRIWAVIRHGISVGRGQHQLSAGRAHPHGMSNCNLYHDILSFYDLIGEVRFSDST